jgi:hypothetical protein
MANGGMEKRAKEGHYVAHLLADIRRQSREIHCPMKMKPPNDGFVASHPHDTAGQEFRNLDRDIEPFRL